MIARAAGGSGPAAGAAEPLDEAYRIVSIHRADAPSGSVGRDWHMYRIAQGINMITGYRRGDAAGVKADVEKIVDALNERRKHHRSRTSLRPNRPAAAPAAAAPAAEDS